MTNSTMVYYGGITFFTKKNAIFVADKPREREVPIYSLKNNFTYYF